MTDIRDLDGWKAIETRLDGAEYEIEAEYLKQPDACPKCGVRKNAKSPSKPSLIGYSLDEVKRIEEERQNG